jgi:hypothetical protein
MRDVFVIISSTLQLVLTIQLSLLSNVRLPVTYFNTISWTVERCTHIK